MPETRAVEAALISDTSSADPGSEEEVSQDPGFDPGHDPEAVGPEGAGV